MTDLEIAFERAAAGHHEADWERFVRAAIARPLVPPEWQWLVMRVMRADNDGFLAAEALTRILAAHAVTRDSRAAALGALSRLTQSAPEGTKIAALEAAVEIDVPAAKALASTIVSRSTAFTEALRAIEAMAP